MLFPIGDDNIERGHWPLFSYALMIINIGVFIFQAGLAEGDYAAFVTDYGVIPHEIVRGIDLNTLFSSLFLHGSWLHLAGNMLYLWIFADNIEATVGNFRFLLFYLLGGLIAGLSQVLIDPSSGIPTIGASGAISAVMGAYIVMFPHSRVKMLFIFLLTVFYIPSWLFLGFWFIQQTLSGMGALGLSAADAGGVAWWAHIGGFVFGLVAGVRFRRRFVNTHPHRVA